MKKNPANPADTRDGAIRRISPKSFERARVLEVNGPTEGIHTAVIKLYESNSQTTAPVLTSGFGDISLPSKDTDVIVMFGENNEPLIIGSWYPVDRVIKNQISVPDYNAGDRVVGNGSGSVVRIHNNGTISITNDGGVDIEITRDGDVVIDGGTKQAITDVQPSGTNSNGGITGLDITRSSNVYLPE